jgi:hypothetical protein
MTKEQHSNKVKAFKIASATPKIATNVMLMSKIYKNRWKTFFAHTR